MVITITSKVFCKTYHHLKVQIIANNLFNSHCYCDYLCINKCYIMHKYIHRFLSPIYSVGTICHRPKNWNFIREYFANRGNATFVSCLKLIFLSSQAKKLVGINFALAGQKSVCPYYTYSAKSNCSLYKCNIAQEDFISCNKKLQKNMNCMTTNYLTFKTCT